METVSTILQWAPWVLGGSTFALVVLAIVATVFGGPALRIANTLLEMVQPLGVGLSEFVVWLVKGMGQGIGVCIHNPYAFFPMMLCLLLGGIFLADLSPRTIKAKAEVATLRKENSTLRKAAKPPPRKAAKPVDEWSLPGWLQ